VPGRTGRPVVISRGSTSESWPTSELQVSPQHAPRYPAGTGAGMGLRAWRRNLANDKRCDKTMQKVQHVSKYLGKRPGTGSQPSCLAFRGEHQCHQCGMPAAPRSQRVRAHCKTPAWAPDHLNWSYHRLLEHTCEELREQRPGPVSSMYTAANQGTCFQSRWPPGLNSSSRSFLSSAYRVRAEDAKKNARSVAPHRRLDPRVAAPTSTAASAPVHALTVIREWFNSSKECS
jgi:hypothetical protein